MATKPQTYVILMDNEQKDFMMTGNSINCRLTPLNEVETKDMRKRYYNCPAEPLYRATPGLCMTKKLRDWLDNWDWMDGVRLMIAQNHATDSAIFNIALATIIPSTPTKMTNNMDSAIISSWQRAARRTGIHLRGDPGSTGKTHTIENNPLSIKLSVEDALSEKRLWGGKDCRGIAEGCSPSVVLFEEAHTANAFKKGSEHMISNPLTSIMDFAESANHERGVSNAGKVYGAKDFFFHTNIQASRPLFQSVKNFFHQVANVDSNGQLTGPEALGRRLSTICFSRAYDPTLPAPFNGIQKCNTLAGADAKTQIGPPMKELLVGLVQLNFKYLRDIYAYSESWISKNNTTPISEYVGQMSEVDTELGEVVKGMCNASSIQRRNWLIPRYVALMILPEMGTIHDNDDQLLRIAFSNDFLDEQKAVLDFDKVCTDTIIRMIDNPKKDRPEKLKMMKRMDDIL